MGGGATLTVKLTGARSNVPLVVFETSDALIVAEPCATGVTVTVGRSPHEVNVIDVGLTVATDELLVDSEMPSAVPPVRLQPFLPSPPRGTT